MVLASETESLKVPSPLLEPVQPLHFHVTHFRSYDERSGLSVRFGKRQLEMRQLERTPSGMLMVRRVLSLRTAFPVSRRELPLPVALALLEAWRPFRRRRSDSVEGASDDWKESSRTNRSSAQHRLELWVSNLRHSTGSLHRALVLSLRCWVRLSGVALYGPQSARVVSHEMIPFFRVSDLASQVPC